MDPAMDSSLLLGLPGGDVVGDEDAGAGATATDAFGLRLRAIPNMVLLQPPLSVGACTQLCARPARGGAERLVYDCVVLL